MRKENLFLLINTVILLVIGGLFLIVYTNFVPQRPEDRLFNQVIELKNTRSIENVPSSGNYAVIANRSDAYNRSGEKIATVYKAIITNDYTFSEEDSKGTIEVFIGIKGEYVFVEIVTLKQTQTYVKGIQNHIYTVYQNAHYLDIENVDITAGTTATVSTGAIQSVVSRAVDLHFGIIRDPLIQYFGENYVKTVDDTFDISEHENVLQLEIVTDDQSQVIGYIYKLSGEGEYSGATGLITDSIGIYAILNQDLEVLGFILPDEEYKHSGGSFKTKNINYLNLFVGLTANQFDSVMNDNDEITAGATGTRNLMDVLLNALKEVILG